MQMMPSIPPKDINLMFEFTEAILDYIYILPLKIQEIQKRINK